jgi:hypothetical protein
MLQRNIALDIHCNDSRPFPYIPYKTVAVALYWSLRS